MKFKHLPILLGLLLIVSPAFAQTIVHDEMVDGELSDLGSTPTAVLLGFGVNTIQGSLGGLGAGGGGGASNGNDADIFTFTLAPGQTVDSITTTRSDFNRGFIGYSNTSSIGLISDNDTLAAAVQAGGLFDTGSVAGASTGGLNPIPGSLSAGDHTFILQETVTPVDFSISFNVVPEPSSGVFLGGLTLLGFIRRRRG